MDYPNNDTEARLANGKFTDGDVTASPVVPPSKNSAAYQNMVFDELLNVITAGGLTPSDQSVTQLIEAINSIVSAARSIAAPAGAVMPFAMTAAPSGWLKCNGQAVSRTGHAELFASIGTTFGVGDGSTTFNLPDLRSEFLRGWDDGRAVDTGRILGSSQSDEFKSHDHEIPEGSRGPGSPSLYASGDDYTSGVYTYSTSNPTGGSETRPRNIALLYCIKV